MDKLLLRARAALRGFSRTLDRRLDDEPAAAARYWAAIGHDMPLQDRGPRLRELSHGAPAIKFHRGHGPTHG